MNYSIANTRLPFFFFFFGFHESHSQPSEPLCPFSVLFGRDIARRGEAIRIAGRSWLVPHIEHYAE